MHPAVFNLALKVHPKVMLIFHLFNKFRTKYRTVPLSNQRTIYVVIGADSKGSTNGGISRVVNYFYSHLIDEQQSPYRVIPVKWDGKTFIVTEKSLSPKSRKTFLRKQVLIWNPTENDILFFQIYTVFGTQDKNKIKAITNRCKIALLIHDMLPITHPEWFGDYLSDGFIRFFDSAWIHADLIIVSCKKVQKDIEAYVATKDIYFGGSNPLIRIVNLWSVATPTLQFEKNQGEIPTERIQPFANSDPVLILLSTVEPRKGHQELISAAKEAWTVGARFNLLFVGRLGWISESFKTEFENFLETECDRAIWYKSVEDDELERLFGLSDILVSPSLDEGYGLPIAEALQRGLPVLANGIPVYQELFGSHAVLYGPGESYSSLVDAFVNIESVISVGSNLVTSVEFPNINSATELLESFGEI
jgi:glycosyltransferase involved in cell wall biosynthesis